MHPESFIAKKHQYNLVGLAFVDLKTAEAYKKLGLEGNANAYRESGEALLRDVVEEEVQDFYEGQDDREIAVENIPLKSDGLFSEALLLLMTENVEEQLRSISTGP